MFMVDRGSKKSIVKITKLDFPNYQNEHNVSVMCCDNLIQTQFRLIKNISKTDCECISE